MKLIRTIFTEILSLFVDDGALAVSVLLWVMLFASPLRPALGLWAGPALFAGLAAFVLIFVVRRALR